MSLAVEEFEAIVVGAGPGGGSVAWSLAREGVRVLVLDAGPAYDVSDYHLHEPQWEWRLFPSRMREDESYVIAPLQELTEAQANLRSWSRVAGHRAGGKVRRAGAYQHVQGVGGTTLHFLGEAHRLRPEAMQLATHFGVGADWPIGYAELEPFYAEAERVIGVAGDSAAPGCWRSTPYPLPAHRLSYASTRIAAGCARLGLTLVPESLAILSDVHDGRPPCNYCGNCVRGCPRADKGSVDVTFVRQAVATGRCVVRPLSQVVELEAGPNDWVTSLRYADRRGLMHRVTGRAVVVACGAVHTPRLLLASAGSQAPHGLANELGLVGRNFMETVAWVSSALHSEPLGSHRGVPTDAICWDFSAPNSIPGVIGGCVFSAGNPQAQLNGPIAHAGLVVGGWGRAHKRAMRDTFGRVLTIASVGECLPSAGSFVDLDPERRDRRGLPLARIHSRLGEMEIRRLAFMADKAREILSASGSNDLVHEYGTYDTFNSSHVFGTCRMGPDPQTSVVDPDCRSHRWRNLFVVDASVFPSSGGGASPSLTIEALGIRAGAHIASRMRRREL